MPTLQEEYDVLAGELRGLNVRLDLPEDDGISQAQPIGAQYDALAGELRGLNVRLGLPENDGIPLTSSANSEYENLVRQNNALDQRLSALFPTFDEWNAEQDELDKRSKWEATKTFTSNFFTGAGAMWDEGVKALDELTSGKAGADSIGGIWEVGKRDFGRFAKTMGGAAVDWLPTTESERSREYRRAKENFDYYQTVRPLMVDAVGGDAKNLVSFGAQFVDPFIFLPVAGTAAKVGAWGLKSARLGRAAAALDKVGDIVSIPSKAVAAATRKGIKAGAYVVGKGAGLVGTVGGGVAKLAALPRTLATKVAQKVLPASVAGDAGGALLAGQIYGAASGVVPFAAQLGIGEIAGFIAKRTGKGLETVLTTLAAPGAQQRFLQRLAEKAESPRMRKLALIAHRKGLTKAGDVAFNALVNGASIASINGALAYLSGESAEGIGQAAGAGMIMGGVLPFGQPGQRAGKSLRSRDATSINYFEGKIAAEQIKEFRKLTPEARLVAATAEEAGIPIPKLFFVDSKMFLEIMRKDDPNAREAQSAMYDPKDKTIYVNQDISSKESSRAVLQIFTEELGHHFITEAIKTDPMFGHQILAEYKAKEGEKSHTFVFERDPDGNPLRTIEINEKGKKLADAYSSISDDVNVGIGNDANLLAQEIGAAQFSIMMDENPNLFPHLAQPIRHKLVNASQKILSLMGITDKFGNTLPLNIASKLKRSPAIRNLYRNYLKQREMHMAGKIDLAEKGQSIPLKRGESAQAGAERMFGATGLSLKDAKSFIINNKQIKRELTNLKNRYQDAPADGWSVPRNKAGNPLGRLIGKKLTPEMRVIFTRTNPDPRGSVNIIINDIQAAIADNGEVNFLYRSGKPSKYSDNELKVRVVAPVGFVITGMAGKGTAGLYMQGMDIAYLKNNVEILVQEGFIKNPDKFIAEARQVAKEANAAGSDGRINPKGKFENELITVALGNKESVGSIFDLKLQALLESGRLQHSFRQYHIGSLAGIALTGRPGIGFDWLNVKRNYSPHGRNFMPRRRSPDDTIPLPFDELPGDKRGEGFARMVDVGKTKTELAEAARKADEQQGWRAGNVRSKDAYGRDKLYMPASEAGAPKGKWKETKERKGFYKYTLPDGSERWIQYNAEQSGNEKWLYYDPTNEFGQTPEESFTFRNKKEAVEHMHAVYDERSKPGDPNMLYMPAAYHGTPHTFKAEEGAPLGRFRSAQIGTGEGVQAYGHGLYFAGRMEVGEYYWKTLSRKIDRSKKKFDGKKYDAENIRHQAAWRLETMLGAREKTINSYKNKLEDARYTLSPKEKKFYQDLVRTLQNKDEAKLHGGSLYKVELAPKENEYLLWDKPLSEQPKGVREKLEGKHDAFNLTKDWKNLRGFQIYGEVVDATLSQPAASAALREAGIPGIKYLEGASRKKGEGDYNYVIFDEADVAITDKLFMPAAKPESVSPNTVQSWDGDPSFPGKYTRGQAKGNDDVGKLFQEKYVEKYGEPIDPYDYTPETTGWLGGMLYDEAKVALARAGNAVDWYTKAVAKAMTIAEEIFPEIKTSAAAKDNFLGALAITSQNMRVLDNARAAVHQYDYKQRHGVFDYKKKHGGKAKMITENLRMFDKLEAGLTDFHTFLDQDFTVKELTEFGQKFFGKEKFAIEGRINDQVKGSAVFGPKIGQGFFQNLKGNYLPVTIDLWLRRTFGRLTGRSVSVKLTPNDIGRLIYSHRHNKGKRKAKNFELPEFLQGLKITGGFAKDGKMNFKITESAFERVFGEHEQGMANAEAVFGLTKELAKDWGREYSGTDRAVAKLKAELASRKKAGQPVKQTAARLEKAEAAKAKLLEEKPLWAFASTSISGKLKPIDIPTPQERTVIVDAFNVALKKLRDEGYDLTPADLQATLWYPEKDIWAFLKGDKADSLNLSYDQAMEIIRDERR